MPTPKPPNEAQRLRTLRRYDILDSDAEAEFDDFTRLAARICGTPAAQITFVDDDRLWYKSNFGVDVTELPREIGFCTHTILQDGIMEVPDTKADPRFESSPLVVNTPSVRFYAGATLVAPDGMGLGALCVADVEPRQLSDEQRDALAALSRQIVRQLDLRVAVKREHAVNARLANAARHLRKANSELEVTVATHLTELSSAEVQLAEAKRAERLGIAAGGLAHDFRNLLAVINGTAELAMLNLDEGNPARQDLEIIQEAGERAAMLTSQMLTRAKACAPEVTDLCQHLERSRPLYDRLLGDAAQLVMTARGGSIAVSMAATRIDQVLCNLLVNARQAMTSGGTVHIVAEPHADGSARVDVRDTGHGMDVATMEQVFEPFYSTKGDEGTGLGLATVKAIVADAGGTIEVSSELGVGTTFSIVLPLAEAVGPPLS